MKYALIENNIVVQIQPNKQAGFIEVGESVVCGMLLRDDLFIAPELDPKSIQQQIDELENSITIRNMYGYNNGDQYAIKKIDAAFAEIELLRAKL